MRAQNKKIPRAYHHPAVIPINMYATKFENGHDSKDGSKANPLSKENSSEETIDINLPEFVYITDFILRFPIFSKTRHMRVLRMLMERR